MTNISNREDVMDSRDIIERIEELRDTIESDSGKDCGDFGGDHGWLEYALTCDDVDREEVEELKSLKCVAEQAADYAPDWDYGSTLIRESYFEEYMDDMIADCYEMPKDMPAFMTITLDYVALRMDYTAVDFDGVIYLIR